MFSPGILVGHPFGTGLSGGWLGCVFPFGFDIPFRGLFVGGELGFILFGRGFPFGVTSPFPFGGAGVFGGGGGVVGFGCIFPVRFKAPFGFFGVISFGVCVGSIDILVVDGTVVVDSTSPNNTVFLRKWLLDNNASELVIIIYPTRQEGAICSPSLASRLSKRKEV